jgi:N-acetylmuramoyl-L-alanine amidase
MAKILKRGMKGYDVQRLQEALHLQPDGIFGKLTEEAVKEWQREHGLDPDGIVGAKTWESIFGNELILAKSKRRIDEIIVHCTASREGQPLTVDAIRRMHIRERGWSDIGYHYVVYLDGSVHEGRNVNISGAHCTGHNTHSIGVVYVGGVMRDGKTPKDTRTEAQKAGLLKLLKDLKKLYPKATIHGHREYANKACPCFDARKEYREL